MKSSLLHPIERAPDDPILGLPLLFSSDPRTHKINLGIGDYKTDKGKSYLFPVVAEAEQRLTAKAEPKDYLAIEGDLRFLESTMALNLGPSRNPECQFALQSIGGTGALSMAAEFLLHFYTKTIAISNPSWANHAQLFRLAGFDVHYYPYYDETQHQIAFKELLNSISFLPEMSVVLLQAACHNPTGRDFTKEQWLTLMQLIQDKKLLPLFDNAYQGLGDSLEADCYPIRLFQQHGVEMLIASAYSKNLGLYGERIGALIFSLNDPTLKKPIMTQLRKQIRSHYSSPPIHGAHIVTEILSHKPLTKAWHTQLEALRHRVQSMRSLFTNELKAATGNALFEEIHQGKGFFTLLGLNEKQVVKLREDYGIYMPLNGRINMAGLTTENIPYVVNSILKVL